MKGKTEFDIKTLLSDSFFIRWVRNPDEESNHYWAKVMDKSPEVRNNVDKAREILGQIRYDQKYALNEYEYAGMLDELIKKHRDSHHRYINRGKNTSWLSMAASILLAVAIGVSAYFMANNEASVETESATAASQVAQKQTNKGEKLTVELPDGTRVKLNSSTEMSYSYGSDQRNIHLNGEAFFEVQKDVARPFIIHTGDITTTVLGTKFNVRSYPEESDIQVAVVEGKVQVGDEALDYQYITANEVSTYQKINRQLKKSQANVDNLVAWHKNILVFEDAGADEVWKRLENWYGVNIKIRNKENIKGKYSGTYKNEPLETVLRGISYASGFEYEIVDSKNVIIK